MPLIFVFRWDDTLMSRDDGLRLYDAFASKEKAMHINPGGHVQIPRSERETWKPFWIRHFGKAEIAR